MISYPNRKSDYVPGFRNRSCRFGGKNCIRQDFVFPAWLIPAYFMLTALNFSYKVYSKLLPYVIRYVWEESAWLHGGMGGMNPAGRPNWTWSSKKLLAKLISVWMGSGP